MKTKQLFAVIVALLMVSSIVSAGMFDSLANIMFKKVEPAIAKTDTGKQAAGQTTGIIASGTAGRQMCSANAECASNSCACRCVANIAAAGGRASLPQRPTTVETTSGPLTLETQQKSPLIIASTPAAQATASTSTGSKTSTASAKTRISIPILGKAIGIKLPSTLISTSTQTKSSSTATTTGTTCTANSQCGTGKVCRNDGVCTAPLDDRTACRRNDQCKSGRCDIAIGTARIGICVAQTLRPDEATCSSNTQCTSGNCDNIRKVCASAPPSTSDETSTGILTASTPSTGTVSSATPIVPTLPSAGTAAPSGSVYTTCLTDCRARCRTECGTEEATTSTSGSTVAGGDSTPTGTLTQPDGQRCTTAADCNSGYCKTSTATITAAVTRQCAPCALNSHCGTGKVCLTLRGNDGLCVTPLINGAQCTRNDQCSSNNCGNIVITGSARIGQCAAVVASITKTLSSSSGVRIALPTGKAISLPAVKTSIGTLTASTKTGSSTFGSTGTTTDSSASTAVSSSVPSIGDCTSRCEARCETTCNPAEETPAKIPNREVCESPDLCPSQCESGRYECSCEGSAILTVGTEPTPPETTPIAESALVVSPEEEQLEMPTSANLAPIEEKLTNLEEKAINDGLVTSEDVEELKQGYDTLSDDEKLENLKARFGSILDTLENVAPDEQKEELRTAKRGITDTASTGKGDARASAQQAATATEKQGFFGRIGSLFTGKAVFITGYAAAPPDDTIRDDSRSGADAASITIPAILSAADVARYRNILAVMDNDIMGIQTKVCNKLKETGFNMNQGPDCGADGACGTSGLMECANLYAGVRSYCKFSLAALCPVSPLTPTSVPTGAGALVGVSSACSTDKQCASGLCKPRAATSTQMPVTFCWCTSDEDCVGGNRCNADTGVCGRIP